jgi:hypothetical protein
MLVGICCLAFSCAKEEDNKYPIEVLIFATNGYGHEFEVDSIKGKFAYKDGIKIELSNVGYIKFK